MDETTKGCVKYLKGLIKEAKKGTIAITVVETEIHLTDLSEDIYALGRKDTGLRDTTIKWRVLNVRH